MNYQNLSWQFHVFLTRDDKDAPAGNQSGKLAMRQGTVPVEPGDFLVLSE